MGTTRARLGGASWLLLVLAVLVEIPVALAWQPPYDPFRLTISDLGATTCTEIAYPVGPVPVCSPLHAWLNVATIGGGVLLLAGALLLHSRVAPGRRGVAFVALMAVSPARGPAPGWCRWTRTSACKHWSPCRPSSP